MILNAMDKFPEQISLVEISLEALGKHLHKKISNYGSYVKIKYPGAITMLLKT